jgi:signal transduction histidine kinase
MQPSRSRWRGWIYPGLGLLVACLGVVQQLASPAAPHLAAGLCACVLAGAAVAILPVAPRTRLPDVPRLAGLAALLLLDAGYQLVAGDPPFATFLATMIAMFHLARSGTRRMMLIGYPATLVTLVGMDIVVSARGQDSPANVIIPIVYFGAASGLGALVRHTANYARIARERGEALEREQVHLADLAAAGERTRLARELHDVISHTVSLMVLQAEAAREVLGIQPERAAEALDTIGDTGRRAIGDLRVLLGVLREPDPNAGPFDLAALVEPVRRTGLRVELVQTGGPVPAPLRATAYRVVQEALTNVLKHAAASSVTIIVAQGSHGLTVEVVDDGSTRPGTPPALPTGSGRGLAGMAERIRAHGGTLEAERLDPQGFRVLARLPGVTT